MNTTVRTYEGRSNTYHFITVNNTTYEQQQERITKVKTAFNKVIKITGLIIFTVISGIVSTELIIPVAFISLLGIAAVITNNI